MASKKAKALKEQELEALHKKVQERKRDLLNEVLANVSAADVFGQADKMHAVLDKASKEEEALSRIAGTIGEIMRQIAVKRRKSNEKV